MGSINSTFNNGSGAGGPPSHLEVIRAVPAPPYFYHFRAFPSSLRGHLDELVFHNIMNYVDKALLEGSEMTIQSIGDTGRLMMLSTVMVVVGFMGGFLMTFLGGVSGDQYINTTYVLHL